MSVSFIPRVCLCLGTVLSRHSCKFVLKWHTDRKARYLFEAWGERGLLSSAKILRRLMRSMHNEPKEFLSASFPMIYPNTGAEMAFIAETLTPNSLSALVS